jgi:hypothetical protein
MCPYTRHFAADASCTWAVDRGRHRAIRDLVLRLGGDIQRDDGSLEDRKGLLAADVAWAELVVFTRGLHRPRLGRQSQAPLCPHGTPFLSLRSGSVARLAAVNGHVKGSLKGR